MGLPQLNSCCCGCTLRTGTLILLWLFVIQGVLSLLNAATILSTVPSRYVSTSDYAMIAVICLIVGISMAIVIVGLFGVYKDRHSYLIPYLSLAGSAIVLQTIGCLIGAIVLPFVADKEELFGALAGSVMLVIVGFLGFALSGYFWLVIYSYYRVVKERSSSRNIA